MKRFLALALTFTLSITCLVGCGNSTDTSTTTNDVEQKGIKVGVSMPTKSLQRWNQDGNNIANSLKEKGYEVDLQFAENEVETQVNQIENMITKGVDILVVGAIDGVVLSAALNEAKSEGIEVIAYDRLIMNTDAVTYYATFDNFNVGVIQGQYIEEKLDLKNGTGPYNFEIATGPLDDNNVVYFFSGAMSILQQYIDSGQLVIKSGQMTREKCATPNWDEQEAQSRMDKIITAYYTSENIDAILCSNDSVALGVQSALKSVGYGKGDKKMPIITGQDANISNVKAIVSGEQSMSVFKDTRALAAKVIEMIDAISDGSEPPINDIETYDNGAYVVPSYLVKPEAVDIDNYEKLLIESGYYTDEQLK